MRTVDYSDILRGTAALAGLNVGDLTPEEFTWLRSAHDRRLQVAWEMNRWPEVCLMEQRSFRAPYAAATSYAAGDEVLDIPTLNYFQSLHAGNVGNPPTLAGQENSAHWAVCRTAYTVDLFNSAVAYAVGNQVRDPVDGHWYQCIAPTAGMIVSGAGYSLANGFYRPDGTYNGRPAYALDYATGGFYQQNFRLRWGIAGVYPGITVNAWLIMVLVEPGVEALRQCIYRGYEDTVTPDLVATWRGIDASGTVEISNNDPPPAVLSGATAPHANPTCWAKLTPFNRYIGWEQAWEANAIGEALALYDRDPRTTTKRVELPYDLSADGIQVVALRHALAYVWLHFRSRRPALKGDTYDPAQVYASGRQVYWTDPLSQAGNFYDAVAPNAAGESPTAKPAGWRVVPLPYLFGGYLIQAGYVDWLKADGQTDKARIEETNASSLLDLEADKLHRQQGQTYRLKFQS